MEPDPSPELVEPERATDQCRPKVIGNRRTRSWRCFTRTYSSRIKGQGGMVSSTTSPLAHQRYEVGVCRLGHPAPLRRGRTTAL